MKNDDLRLRGKGNYTFTDLVHYAAKAKLTWLLFDQQLVEYYHLTRVVIEDSPSEGWGINYRVNNKHLCYVHPEKDALQVAFQLKEAAIEPIIKDLSAYAQDLWINRYPCGKGGWIWYRITKEDQIPEVMKLLLAKMKATK